VSREGWVKDKKPLSAGGATPGFCSSFAQLNFNEKKGLRVSIRHSRPLMLIAVAKLRFAENNIDRLTAIQSR
jgi:hypothetical protein